ncbi:MAG: hypothetical protein IJ714_08450 [Bacteroidales bacterium]|nr:hypothetical protein [Bacteroidales bacterium]
MKYKKTLPYTLKLTAAIGLPLLLGACNKTEPEPQHDIIIELDGGNVKELEHTFEKYDVDAIKKLAHDKSVHYIYLTPVSSWAGSSSNFMKKMGQNFLQPRLAASPKVRGRGDFRTDPGVMAAIPTDSLWYVQNGWTFNKQYQK